MTELSKLWVRPWRQEDISSIINYFLNASEAYIRGMGADPSRLPPYDKWYDSLAREIRLEPRDQGYYYVIWMLGDRSVGHTNVNLIEYGQKAHMHLHLWEADSRRSGLGTSFIIRSIPLFFERFDLAYLISEPYADNPAPHKTLARAGFTFVQQYNTIPGPINFRQDVRRYRIDKSDLNDLC